MRVQVKIITTDERDRTLTEESEVTAANPEAAIFHVLADRYTATKAWDQGGVAIIATPLDSEQIDYVMVFNMGGKPFAIEASTGEKRDPTPAELEAISDPQTGEIKHGAFSNIPKDSEPPREREE